MTAKKLDFSDFEEQNTLIISVPEYVDGKATGKLLEWKIPPISLETEMSFRKIQSEQMKLISAVIRAQSEEATEEDVREAIEVEKSEEENPRYTADFWAPIVALFVKNTELDAEELKKNFPGQLLRRVGQTARDFFLSGALPEELMERDGVSQQAS